MSRRPALQYFEHVEEAEWAVQVLKASGKPVAANMCIGPEGDMHGVSAGECAVRLVKAGVYIPSSSLRLLAVVCSLVVWVLVELYISGANGWRHELCLH